MIELRSKLSRFTRPQGMIRRRLMKWGLALLGLALVLNTAAGLIYTRSEIKEASGELQLEMASATARHIHSFITRKVERLQDTAVAMTLYPLGGAEQRLLGQLLLKNDGAFSELSMLDEKGMELFKFSERKVYLPSDLEDRSSSQSFTKAIRGGSYLGPVHTSDRAEPFITLAVPLKEGPQRSIGVLVAQTNLKFLWEVIGGSKFGDGGYAYLVDKNGVVIAHQDASLVLKQISLRNLPKVQQFLRELARDPTPGEQSQGITGKPVLSTFAPVSELGWAVIVEEPVELALSDITTLQRYALFLLLAGLLVGAVIIVWVSDKITKPILQLRRGVETIRSGNLDHRVDVTTGDEIEELAEEFNKMTETLRSSYSTLEQKVEQRTQEVSALYDVTTTVNQSLDLDSVLQAVIQKITQIFKFDTTRVYLFDPETEELNLRAYFETNPQPEARTGSIKRETIVGRVAVSGEPLFFEDVQIDPRYREWSLSKNSYNEGLRFFAVFPIKTKSRTFGAISFKGKERRKLREEEIRLLNSMSEHVAVAVEKASLFEQAKARSEQLAVLNTIAAAVSQSLDLDVVLNAAIEKVVETLRFDASWIYLLDPSETELHLKAYNGLTDEIAQSMAKRTASAGIGGRVIETDERLVFEDLRTDERYRSLTAGRKVGSLGFIAAAGFPIRTKEKIIGVLHVANRAKRHFAPVELQLIESLAQEIGVAVENARLFSEVKEKTSELLKMNEELQEATRVKSEFIASMSHELRTPLNIIIGNADLTRDEFFGELNADQKDAVQKISRYARILLKMINNVLTLTRLEAKKMSLDVSTVEVQEIIAQAQTHVEQMNRDNHLEIRWDVEDDVPSLLTDPIKLEEILQNLIGNAFKFTPTGRIEVQVRNLLEQDRIEFRVADTGVGIDAADLEKIFNEFEQIREAHTGNQSGVGLGLSIVKKYLELMQGDIRVESQLGQGSTFTFSLPRTVSTNS